MGVLAGADAGVIAGAVEPWNDDALDEEDALREADGEADTPGPPRPPAVDAAAEEVSPAGEGVGVDGFPPVKAITAKPAAAAAIRPPMTHASTNRRRGRLLAGGGG